MVGISQEKVSKSAFFEAFRVFNPKKSAKTFVFFIHKIRFHEKLHCPDFDDYRFELQRATEGAEKREANSGVFKDAGQPTRFSPLAKQSALYIDTLYCDVLLGWSKLHKLLGKWACSNNSSI